MVTAQEVKKLRDKTSAGMMDCKEALEKAGGDFDKAIEFLRKKGGAIAASRANKITGEGGVFLKTDTNGKWGCIVSLGCETDFVANTSGFKELGECIVTAASLNDVCSCEVLYSILVGSLSIREKIDEYVCLVKEKIVINRFEVVTGDMVIPYVHQGGRLGVLVGLGNENSIKASEIGKEIAMQIAAMNPIVVMRSDLDPMTIKKEEEIFLQATINEGHSGERVAKVVQGKMNKFYKESVLMEQDFIKDNSMSVGQYLNKSLPGAVITRFVRVVVS